MRERFSSVSDDLSVFLEAGSSPDNSVRPRIRCSSSGISNNFCLECSTAALRPDEAPIPKSEPGVIVVDKVVLIRLSVMPRPIWIFELVSRTGLSQNVTEGHPPTRHILGRTRLLFTLVKRSLERVSLVLRGPPLH